MARIARKTLHEVVAERLRDMIVEGELEPGVVVPETALCTTLGVSRTPIREALKLLVLNGLVEHWPQRGFTVRVLEANDARQMIELLAELEGFASVLACERGTDEDIGRIAQLHETMLIAYRAGDMSRYFNLNQEIHDSIVALSGNLALCDTHHRLSEQLRRVRFLSNRTETYWQSSVEDHEKILKLLISRDATAIRPLVTRHVLDIWKVVGPTFEHEAALTNSLAAS